MNGAKYLLDTNIVLYILNGNADLVTFLNHQRLCVSIITEMELMSYPAISKKEASDIRDFIDRFDIYPLDERVKDAAINIRRKYKLKLPDSIVAATALIYAIPLITADKQFNKISGVEILIYDPAQNA